MTGGTEAIFCCHPERKKKAISREGATQNSDRTAKPESAAQRLIKKQLLQTSCPQILPETLYIVYIFHLWGTKRTLASHQLVT